MSKQITDKSLSFELRDIETLIPYANNSRTHSKEQIDQVVNSIKEFGFINPVIISKDGGILAGHCRVMAAKRLGMKSVPCILETHLTATQRRAYVIADNQLALNAGWDEEKLSKELAAIQTDGFDLDLLGFSTDELEQFLKDDKADLQASEDDFDESASDIPKRCKRGDIWQCGNHRLMCGDSTSAEDVAKLMNGEKADLVFTDPPYGMKKEADGIANDNLNYEDLLEFNKKWIPLSFANLKDVGSWYCWGIDEPLMDIYAFILKPMIKENKITFRNLLTWDKGTGQGQNSDVTRCYATAAEKCIFVMCGVQGFNTNADHYFEGWEPIRDYLLKSRKAMGWDVPTMKEIVGHSDKSRDHWTGKSQFNLPTRKVYERLKEEAEIQRSARGIENDAFKREYDEIKREYDEIKREYYSTRAYFNNTHDNMNNVWHFPPTSIQERELTGGHATPKPIALCARAIKSSSRESETVLDLFGGSGTTMIACEQLQRKARLMELDEHYCDVILHRWETLTGKSAEKI